MADHEHGVPPQGRAADPFHDLAQYLALPRLSGLAVSPDGTRLVTAVAIPSADGKKYASALWDVEVSGTRAPQRLTRSALGESQPAFLPDGRLLFTSRRPDTASADEQDDDLAALWVLPAGNGEARRVASHAGGIGEVAVARESGDVVLTASVLAGSSTPSEDENRRKARKDAGVTAILHERHPVRHWDHDLGPGQTRVFTAGQVPPDDGEVEELRDLTPVPEGRVQEGIAVSPDGGRLAVVWRLDDVAAADRLAVAVLDTASGERLLLVEEADTAFFEPRFSPDGRGLVCVREGMGRWDEAPNRTLWYVELDSGNGRDLLPGATIWPSGPAFSPDGNVLFFAADDLGRAPVFRLDLDTGSVTRLTASGAHTDVVVTRDGRAVYALRSAIDEPPTPVRIDPEQADQEPARLPSPGTIKAVPGHVAEITTRADDGVTLRAWLAVPDRAAAQSPAPLVLWVHGGPLSSWNSWSWRWNPWLLVAQGYAVLLPDPAVSTGYGYDFISRGWGSWGDRPFTDLMSIIDAACGREDIDETRTAAMGGSFGGYMANWIATQTDRFRAIVTHASLWHLDQFAGTTDEPSYWQREFGDPLQEQERYQANSPHLRVAAICTPMLVIHGDKDYRVPIGEAMRLWYDLCRFSVPAKFLYFPDENHWVLKPGNARVWYETVIAFLAHHVDGKDWEQPSLL